MPLLVQRTAGALRAWHAADRADGRPVGGGRLFRAAGCSCAAVRAATEIAAAFAASIAYEAPLALKLIDGLSQIDGLTIHGITDPARVGDRVPTVSFTIAGIRPETLVRQLNAENIFVWSGHNYAWEIVHQLGIPADEGVIRIGAAHYNTSAEIDETVAAVQRLVAMLRQQRALAAKFFRGSCRIAVRFVRRVGMGGCCRIPDDE